MEERIELGIGRLTWPASERRSDRYGKVFLIEHSDSLSAVTPPIVPLTLPPACRHTEIFEVRAVVQETRQSTHIGDLFHGVFPRTPQVGQEITLGSGRLHVDESGYLTVVPEEVGAYPWMDMRALYDAHEQTVQLVAVSKPLAEANAAKTDKPETHVIP